MGFRRLVLALVLLGCLLVSRIAAAHGGGIAQVENVALGDFVATVWLNPGEPSVGTVHITVALAKDQQPVLNQDVMVLFVPASGDGAPISRPATHENSTSKFLYETDAEIDDPGEWRVLIKVKDVAEDVSFVMDVAGRSWINSPYLAIGSVGVLAAVWWLGRGRGGREE